MAAVVGTSYADATKIKVIDSHTYEVDLRDDWAIGTVPHGGYVTAVFLAATEKHFLTTLSSQNQPHCLTLHLSFLRRTATGPATLTIKDMKLGGQTSVVHVTLSQPQKDRKTGAVVQRDEVVGYITQANLSKPFTGGMGVSISQPTSWSLVPGTKPVELSKLASGEDSLWTRVPPWQASFRRAYTRYEVYGLRGGNPDPSISDEWIRLENGQRITQTTLGSVVDLFPLMIDQFRDHLKANGTEEEKRDVQKWPQFWCPTIVLNMEVKKVLPKEGLEWVFVRVRAKELKEGRMDYEIVAMDPDGELLALSHHTIMVLSAGRNLAERGNGKDGSKM